MHQLQNAFCRSLGIDVPIFGLAHRVEVAAAISNAGGLGVYAAARDGPSELAAQLKKLRQLCPDRPVGVDLLLPTSLPKSLSLDEIRQSLPKAHVDFVDGLFKRFNVPAATQGNFFSQYVRSQSLFEEQMDAVVASDVEVFAAGVGTPLDVIARAKAAGKYTMSLIGTPKHAQKAMAAGVDALVAQGYDAGGHTGQIGTLSLIPQIVACAKGLPVLAAGGIGTGSQIVASLAMGAQAAWLGTQEHQLPKSLTDKLISAGSEDTVITKAHSGKPCRVIQTDFSRVWSENGAPAPLDMPYQQALIGQLLAAVEEHDIEPLVYEAAGQSVAWIDEIQPVSAVMGRLVAEMHASLNQIARYSK